MTDYVSIVKTIITPLVEDASSLDVKVLPTSIESEVKILVIARENDISKLIGKEGRNANSLRQLVRASASDEHKKIIIDFESF